MMKQPHVVYGADNRYLAPLLVSMYSVLRFASRSVRITVFTTDPPIVRDAPGILRLKDCFPEAEIRIQHFDVASLCEYEHTAPTRWPAVTMIPLFIPWLINDRCVFLDADTIVLQDIAELYSTDMKGMPFGACQSPTHALMVRKHLTVGLHSIFTPTRTRRIRQEVHEWKGRLGFTLEDIRTMYFNSGVLLYETEAIREIDPDRKLANIELSRKHWNSMPDMDRLNEFFKDRVHLLDLKWNVGRELMAFNQLYASSEFWSRIVAAAREPGVLHYHAIFRRKPWRRPWFKKKRSHRVYKRICMEMEKRTGIEILRMLDQGSAPKEIV